MPGFDPAKARVTVNRWIAGESERALAAVTEAMQAFRFNEAASAIYHFIWHVFCDWYLELIKPILAGDDARRAAETRAMTAWVLDRALTAAASLHALRHRGALGEARACEEARREPA